MSTRLALACSLVLLGACGKSVIGSARAPDLPEGGLDPIKEDDLLSLYTQELEGEWTATSPDRAATFTIDFMRSHTRLRSGIVQWMVQVDCSIAVPSNFPVPIRPCLSSEREPPRFPEPETWDVEYWLLKLDGTDAIVSMLLDPSQVEGVSFTCRYAPKPAPAQIKCGVTGFGFQLSEVIFTRPSQ